jgi:hypothetical protein
MRFGLNALRLIAEVQRLCAETAIIRQRASAHDAIPSVKLGKSGCRAKAAFHDFSFQCLVRLQFKRLALAVSTVVAQYSTTNGDVNTQMQKTSNFFCIRLLN